MKGVDRVIQHLENEKVASDNGNLPFEAEEGTKETKRVGDAEKMNSGGRIKFHKTLENDIEKITAGAKKRFMDEPFYQFYDEMENQIFEDSK